MLAGCWRAMAKIPFNRRARQYQEAGSLWEMWQMWQMWQKFLFRSNAGSKCEASDDMMARKRSTCRHGEYVRSGIIRWNRRRRKEEQTGKRAGGPSGPSKGRNEQHGQLPLLALSLNAQLPSASTLMLLPLKQQHEDRARISVQDKCTL